VHTAEASLGLGVYSIRAQKEMATKNNWKTKKEMWRGFIYSWREQRNTKMDEAHGTAL